MSSVLVLIADDVALLDFDEFLPQLPNFQAMLGQGIKFTRAYSPPVCGPSRYSIHTGEWGRRKGILTDVGAPTLGLPPGVVTLGEMAAAAGVATALVGKWHLGGPVLTGALERGYEYWRAGTYLNLNDPARGSHNYTDWFRIDDGAGAHSAGYATNKQGLAAVDWWNTVPGDKLLVLSLNTPHGPLHRPPPVALPAGYSPPQQADARHKFFEMCLTLDVCLGSLVQNCVGISDALTVFCGDNGTSDGNLPFGVLPGKAKETPYERGIHVPLVVRPAGGVPATIDTDLRHLSDIWQTAAAQLGFTGGPAIDSRDLLGPGHPYVISEAQLADGTLVQAVMRFDGWKLLQNGGPQKFFYLPDDPLEENPIPASSIPETADELRELLATG